MRQECARLIEIYEFSHESAVKRARKLEKSLDNVFLIVFHDDERKITPAESAFPGFQGEW